MTWEKTIIGKHCTVTSSKRFHLSDRSDNGVPFYCSKEIIQKVNGQAITQCDYIKEEAYETIKAKYGVPQYGDLLITTRGTYGVPYIYRADDKFYFADGNLTWLKDFDEKLYPNFLYYWILSYEGQKKIDAIAKGTAQKAVPIALIKEIELYIPNIKIQQKIVKILSAYDDLIENSQKQIKLLEEAAQRLYKEWFVDFRFPGYENTPIINGVPEGWKRGILDDIAKNTGIIEKKENRDKYKYYLPIDCIPKKSLTYIEKMDVNLAESSLIAFKPTDLLFGALRPYFHKVAIAYDDGLTRSTCFVINAKNQVLWSYLAMLLFADSTVNYATTISVGTTMPYVRWNDFMKMEVLIPSVNICEKFGEKFKCISEKIINLAKQIKILAEARDRLLPKLMSGELEV